MIGNFLNHITEMSEYRLALRVLNSENENFSDEECGKILDIYGKFMPDVENKLTFRALAILDTAGENGGVEQSPLKELLKEEDFNVLTKIAAVSTEKVPTNEEIQTAVALPDGVLKIALCRLLLDKLAAFSRLSEVGAGISALSGRLKSAGEGELYDGSLIVAEVKNKWR